MKLVIYTDGASRGNPGPSSYGFTIQDEKGHLLEEGGEYIGITTNNVAEYTAVLEALKHAKKLVTRVNPSTSLGTGSQESRGKLHVELYADSKLVAEQLSGRYKIKAKHLKPIISLIQNLAIELGGIIFSYIPRSQNTLADKLANQALDLELR